MLGENIADVGKLAPNSGSFKLEGGGKVEDAYVLDDAEGTSVTNIRFQASDTSHNRVQLGPDFNHRQVYEYLKNQVAKLFGMFPGSTVKSCVMNVDVLVDHNSPAKN